MTVSDQDISDAEDYLGCDEHAVAKFRYTKAKHERERVYWEEFKKAIGTSNDMRRAMAETSPDHLAAKAAEAQADFEYQRHQNKKEWAHEICQMWRTSRADLRAVESIR